MTPNIQKRLRRTSIMKARHSRWLSMIFQSSINRKCRKSRVITIMMWITVSIYQKQINILIFLIVICRVVGSTIEDLVYKVLIIILITLNKMILLSLIFRNNRSKKNKKGNKEKKKKKKNRNNNKGKQKRKKNKKNKIKNRNKIR